MSDLVVALIALIARVCQCCENARWNKRSSRRVKTCLEGFEKVLVRMRETGSWEKHVEALWTLRGALGEAEAVLTRISGRSKMAAMRYAREDHRQLKDVEKKLAQASDLLQVNLHVSADQQANDFNEDLLELMRQSETENQTMHQETQQQINKLTQMLKDHLDVNTLTEQLSEVSVAIDADDTVTAADVGVFAKEALVVGVKSYKNSPLRNTLNDATDVAEKLKEMGFRVELSLDPTLDEFDKAQDAFESRLGPGVLAFVFFSGHGCEYEGDNYLFMKETPDGVDERRLERTATRVSALMDGIRSREAAFTVLVLDACRSVRVTRLSREANTGGLAEAKPTKFKLKNAGVVIAYATAPRETASDGTGKKDGRNGFYTHHLLKYLAEEKPVRDMLEEVSFAIVRESGGKQQPWVHSWMGSKRAQRIQLAGVEWGSSGPDMVEPEIVVQPGIWESNPNKVQNLFDAAKDGNVALIKRLVDAGADVNAVDEDAQFKLGIIGEGSVYTSKLTPLHYAAGFDRVAAIRCLVIECNANVEAEDNVEFRPLHYAALKDNVAAIWCLVNVCNANVEVCSDGEFWRGTPLIVAAWFGNAAAIRCLVNECKANVDGPERGAPLLCAATMNNTAAIECLVRECKANVEAGDQDGYTPLHWAASHNNVAAIRFLVSEYKANVEAVSASALCWGRTPLHLAANENNLAAIRCLVNECQANVEAVDEDGDKPLQRATQQKTKQVLRELGAKT